ncbi:MAG: XdhC family protein, partial [Acetobacteraceae bacterium]
GRCAASVCRPGCARRFRCGGSVSGVSPGSSPRPAGSRMALTASGRMAGSVSGGCIEGAVAEAAGETLRTGIPRLLDFGVSNERAWEVGLACGGKVKVFVERIG